MLPRTRFGFGYNPGLVQGAEESSVRIEIVTPTRGLHQGDAPQDLQQGSSPAAYNWVWDGGYIMPRSGLSQFKGGASGLSGAALGAFRMGSATGDEFLVSASDRTISVYDPTAAAWSQLSYINPSAGTSVPSGNSRDYWAGAYIFDGSANANIGVLTNNVDMPMVFTLTGSIATYSNITDFASLASRAASVCAFDNRLVWLNTDSSTELFPTRVLWSARGLPRNYQILDGAGADDLLDMRGQGTRIIADADGLLVFSTEEIWRGRRRGDVWVFDFHPIERQFGCPFPRTIVNTPMGVIFLARDLELYLVRGNEAVPLGPAAGEERASKIQRFMRNEIYEAERAWACYNPIEQRYELYYTGPDSAEGYPTRGLYYSLAENAFFPQRFGHELSAGVAYVDPDQPLTWDDLDISWDDISASWDDSVVPGTGFYVTPFSSTGTSFHFNPTQGSDDGSAYTAQWTSHALNRADPARYEQLTDVWVEYQANSDTSLSVQFGDDLDFGNYDECALSLPAGLARRAHAVGHAIGVSPHFRIVASGEHRPKLARFQAKLVEAGLFEGGP